MFISDIISVVEKIAAVVKAIQDNNEERKSLCFILDNLKLVLEEIDRVLHDNPAASSAITGLFNEVTDAQKVADQYNTAFIGKLATDNYARLFSGSITRIQAAVTTLILIRVLEETKSRTQAHPPAQRLVFRPPDDLNEDLTMVASPEHRNPPIGIDLAHQRSQKLQILSDLETLRKDYTQFQGMVVGTLTDSFALYLYDVEAVDQICLALHNHLTANTAVRPPLLDQPRPTVPGPDLARYGRVEYDYNQELKTQPVQRKHDLENAGLIPFIIHILYIHGTPLRPENSNYRAHHTMISSICVLLNEIIRKIPICISQIVEQDGFGQILRLIHNYQGQVLEDASEILEVVVRPSASNNKVVQWDSKSIITILNTYKLANLKSRTCLMSTIYTLIRTKRATLIESIINNNGILNVLINTIDRMDHIGPKIYEQDEQGMINFYVIEIIRMCAEFCTPNNNLADSFKTGIASFKTRHEYMKNNRNDQWGYYKEDNNSKLVNTCVDVLLKNKLVSKTMK